MTDTAAAPAGDNGGAPAGGAPDGGAPGANDTPVWTEGFDEDSMAYVQNKGWENPQDMLTSYQHVERFAGGAKDLVQLPGADADEDALGKFYNSLGRPEAPDGYSFDTPDGGDQELTDWFRSAAHKHGLTDKQASDFLNEYQEMAGGRIEAMENAIREQGEKDLQGLQKEWGKGYETQVEAGRRAADALGYDKEELTTLEDKLGTSEMMKLFARLGSKMGEDTFEDGKRGGGANFGITPAQAQQQIADLKLDKGFMDKYLTGDKDAIAKMTRLMEFANG